MGARNDRKRSAHEKDKKRAKEDVQSGIVGEKNHINQQETIPNHMTEEKSTNSGFAQSIVGRDSISMKDHTRKSMEDYRNNKCLGMLEYIQELDRIKKAIWDLAQDKSGKTSTASKLRTLKMYRECVDDKFDLTVGKHYRVESLMNDIERSEGIIRLPPF